MHLHLTSIPLDCQLSVVSFHYKLLSAPLKLRPYGAMRYTNVFIIIIIITCCISVI